MKHTFPCIRKDNTKCDIISLRIQSHYYEQQLLNLVLGVHAGSNIGCREKRISICRGTLHFLS